jgi:hypothetical protein
VNLVFVDILCLDLFDGLASNSAGLFAGVVVFSLWSYGIVGGCLTR